MNAADLRAYAARRWDLVEGEKDFWRAQRYRQHGPAATLAAALALRERWRRIHGAPSEARRAADFAHHVELKRKLESVSGVAGK